MLSFWRFSELILLNGEKKLVIMFHAIVLITSIILTSTWISVLLFNELISD